jgi:hypothetical protein
VNVRKVQMALEAWGIEFSNHGGPGVRQREPVAMTTVAPGPTKGRPAPKRRKEK